MDGELFVKFPAIRRIFGLTGENVEGARGLTLDSGRYHGFYQDGGRTRKEQGFKALRIFLEEKTTFLSNDSWRGKELLWRTYDHRRRSRSRIPSPRTLWSLCQILPHLLSLLDSFIYLFVVERWQKKNNVSTWQETVRKERLSYWTTVVWLPLRFAFNQLAVQLRHKMQ